MDSAGKSQDHEARKTELPVINTTLAADRTLFAAIRTALSLNAFGFTLAKFVHEMIETGSFKGSQSFSPRLIGFALMGLGLATLIGGGYEYVRIARQIHSRGFVMSVSLIVTICLVVLGVLLIWSLSAEISFN